MSSLDFDKGLEMPTGAIPEIQGEDLLGFSGDMTAAAPAEKHLQSLCQRSSGPG